MKPELAAFNGPLKRGDRILDKYEVRGLLGKGGHAYVYDCFNAFLAEEVAIKLIPNLEHHGSRFLKRARGEAQVLYRLNHPNVVRVMDGGEFNGMAYIVMEKLNGTSLRQTLRKRGSLPVIEALLIGLQIAEALEAAHAMNVIHRDLKPDNVFLLAENHVKVLDFGIAKFVQGEPTTQRDLIQGTAPYMSPEHAQGLGVTFASDIFQLGTMLYEMIAGVCPCMVGLEDVTLQELVAIQITKLPPRLKLLVRGVPDYVDRLVWRAIAKQAQQRFASMPAFTEAIRNALERLDVDLPRERLQRVTAASRSSSHPPPAQGMTDSGVVETVPLAQAAPKPTRHSNAPASAPTPPMPAGTPANVARSRQRPLAPPQKAARPERSGNWRGSVAPVARAVPIARSTSATLIRAAVVGALAALPIGVVCGLARRASTGAPTTAARNGTALNGAALNGAALNGAALNGAALNGAALNGAALGGAALNPTIAQPRAPSPSASVITAEPAENSRLDAAADRPVLHSARSLPSINRASVIALTPSTKSPPLGLAVGPASGLDQLAAPTNATSTSPNAPGPTPARDTHSGPKKSIF